MEPKKAKARLFSLGTVVATPGIMDALSDSGEYMRECLSRHQAGDWGILTSHDKEENDRAAKQFGRILSAYPINPEDPASEKFWIITEADRSATTFLLPEEY